MRAAAGQWEYTEVDQVHLHDTADPEVVIAEYRLHATVLATGRPFTATYVMVVRVRDGLIAASRDYFNVLENAEARGVTPDLIAGMIKGAG